MRLGRCCASPDRQRREPSHAVVHDPTDTGCRDFFCCPGVAPRPGAPKRQNPLTRVSAGRGGFRCGTPDRIRTGATALRGRRARPLHNGGLHSAGVAAATCGTLLGSPSDAPIAVRWDGDLAGILGLEPRLTEPESVVLPITPYPTVLLVFGPVATLVSQGLRAEEKPYTRGSERSKTFRAPGCTWFEMPILRAAQIDSPR